MHHESFAAELDRALDQATPRELGEALAVVALYAIWLGPREFGIRLIRAVAGQT